MLDSKLRDIIQQAKYDTRLSLDDLTVLSRESDPYRLTGDRDHENAQGLVKSLRECKRSMPIHPRGIHYALFMSIRADGEPLKIYKPNGSLHKYR